MSNKTVNYCIHCGNKTNPKGRTCCTQYDGRVCDGVPPGFWSAQTKLAKDKQPTTAELSDHTMAVFLSQEVATLTVKLEVAEADYKKLLKRDTDNLNKLIKAKANITALEAEKAEFRKGCKELIERWKELNYSKYWLMDGFKCADDLYELLKQEQEL